MPSLGGFPAFVTFSASSVLPGLSRAFHGGTWFPPGRVAGRGLGSQGGRWGWPQAGPVPHMCPFEGHLRTLSLPSPVTAPTPVYPDPPAVHAVGGGSKAWGGGASRGSRATRSLHLSPDRCLFLIPSLPPSSTPFPPLLHPPSPFSSPHHPAQFNSGWSVRQAFT